MQRQVILLTHGKIGAEILRMAKETLDTTNLPVHFISVTSQVEPAEIQTELKKITDQYSQQDILILADLYGATPCNIAQPFQDLNHIKIVSGLNLSMLLKVLNHLSLEQTPTLDDLVRKAVSGGIAGIIECKKND